MKYGPFQPLFFPSKWGRRNRASIPDLEDLGCTGQASGIKGSVIKGKAEDDKNGAIYQPPCDREEENGTEIVSMVRVGSSA